MLQFDQSPHRGLDDYVGIVPGCIILSLATSCPLACKGVPECAATSKIDEFCDIILVYFSEQKQWQFCCVSSWE